MAALYGLFNYVVIIVSFPHCLDILIHSSSNPSLAKDAICHFLCLSVQKVKVQVMLTLYYQKEWKMKTYNTKSQAHTWSMVTPLPYGDVAPLSLVHGAANSSALLWDPCQVRRMGTWSLSRAFEIHIISCHVLWLSPEFLISRRKACYNSLLLICSLQLLEHLFLSGIFVENY